MNTIELIDQLSENNTLKKEEYLYILNNITSEEAKYLFQKAASVSKSTFDNKVYLRALIEFSNYCNKNCFYCGLQASNKELKRYRLSYEEILKCCKTANELGYKTFVLQSGEDNYYTDEFIIKLLKEIKNLYPDIAITLSIGERNYESYQKFYEAGCDRYLLRHEASNKELYEFLHPKSSSYENRINCIKEIKKSELQTGIGFMVGSPNQTNENLVDDLKFIEKINPDMCGIGPYITHSKTKFSNYESAELEKTLIMISLTRLISPKCLLPATTALGSLDKMGREYAILAGANVLMPKVTPQDVRKNYELYENMICLDDDASKCNSCIKRKIKYIGYECVDNIGNTKIK